MAKQTGDPDKASERDAILFDETALSPEVIRAGAEILLGYDLDSDLPTDVARWVFCAMIEALRQEG